MTPYASGAVRRGVMMEFAGSFQHFSFVDVMRSIGESQRTGRLSIANGNLRAAIYFASGQWLLAERSGPGQLLAQQFAKSGIVSPEQIEAICGVPYVQAGEIPDVQLVRALISARALTQEQLRAWAMSDAVALLIVVLSWSNGEFRFDDNVGTPAGRVALPMPIAPLMAQAMRHMQPAAPPAAPPAPAAAAPAREVALPPAEAVIDFVEVDPESGAAIQLTREQWRLLTAVDGLGSLRAIARTLHAPESVILRIGSELVAQGIVMIVSYAAAGEF